jgi:IS5 family transposase
VHVHLESRGVRVSKGTIVDATIIAAPPSTKNKDKAGDPGMHQTKKGNQWHFGMKAHIGVDSKTKVIHAVVATAANLHDSAVLGDLLHGKETRVWGDRAYQGKTEKIRAYAPNPKDFTSRRYRFKNGVDEVEKAKNTTKSRVRAKVEHPFGVIKRIFGFTKVRYRELEKNANRLFVACSLANIFMLRRRLIRA